MDKNNKKQLDIPGLYRVMAHFKNIEETYKSRIEFWFEDVHSMPANKTHEQVINGKKLIVLDRVTQGIASTWSFAKNTGIVLGVIHSLGRKVRFVKPSVWKKVYAIPGKKKDDSRLKAIEMFPEAAESLKFKKYHNRADALIIAAFGKNTNF